MLQFLEPLWAIDRSRWDNIASGMKPRSVATAELLWLVAVLLTAGFCLWLVLKWLSGRDKERINSPLRLFLGLCRGHKLTWRESWLLWQVAAAHRLKHPARLFLEPHWLDPAQLPIKLRGKESLLGGLRERLFAEDEPEATSEPPAAETVSQPAVV